MRIGVFADTHDHVDHTRLAVQFFNKANCELVVFAGDFVSPIVIPPLRRLNCPMLSCFGDNEGNRTGISGGMRIVGPVASPPFGFEAADGTRFLVTHVDSHLKDHEEGADVIIAAHTHRPRIWTDDAGRLRVNPGETSGWTFRCPTVVLIETESRSATVHELLDESDPFRRKPSDTSTSTGQTST